MAYRLKNHVTVIDLGVLATEHDLVCYDTIDDPLFDLDRDGHLEARSAWELVRDQLNDAQHADLDRVDAFWQANPKDFNTAFEQAHFQHRRETALDGFVTDASGKTPPLPADHWWWRPIAE